MIHGKNILGIPSNLIYITLFVVLMPLFLRLVSLVTSIAGVGPSAKEEAEEKRKETERAAAGSGVSPQVLQSDAQAISHALGTAYSWFDWRNWTEDEASAIRVVSSYSPSGFLALEKAYRIDVARSLRADLQKYLSPSDYESLKIHMDGQL